MTTSARDGRVVQFAHGGPRRTDAADERARREPFAVQHRRLRIRCRQHDVRAFDGLLSGSREYNAMLLREFRPTLLTKNANVLDGPYPFERRQMRLGQCP